MTPTRQCPICGSEWLLIQAQFDEEGELTFYDLDAQCNNCLTPLKAPTPIDYIHLKKNRLKVVK
jgi:hypothetical protein